MRAVGIHSFPRSGSNWLRQILFQMVAASNQLEPNYIRQSATDKGSSRHFDSHKTSKIAPLEARTSLPWTIGAT
jgi:hypothetical protein